MAPLLFINFKHELHDPEDITVGKPYNIYIVEDSEIYRMVLERFLSKMTNIDHKEKPACKVVSFESGEECLKMIDKEHPDIVVMDYFLNGKKGVMDGLQLLKVIKKESPETEVIVLSEQKDVLITAELFNLGASAYIAKEHQAHNRVENAVLNTIKKIEKKRKFARRKIIWIIVLLVGGMIIGALLFK